jgi:hypothetical protein
MLQARPLIGIDGSALWDQRRKTMVPVDLLDVITSHVEDDAWTRDRRVEVWIDDYEMGMMRLLDKIAGTQTGHILLEEWTWMHKITLVPFSDARNSVTLPLDFAASLARRRVETIPGPPGRGRRTIRVVGTGLGSDARIAFNPWISQEIMGAGMKADQFLFHELVHAIRMNEGLTTRRPMGFGFDLREEFIAVVIANVYVSESDPSSSLRANHHADSGKYAAYGIPSLEMLDMRRFTQSYRRELQDLRDEMPGLTTKLARVKCSFNPFKFLADEDAADLAARWKQPGAPVPPSPALRNGARPGLADRIEALSTGDMGRL